MTPEDDDKNAQEETSTDLTPEQSERVRHYRERIYPVLSDEAKARVVAGLKISLEGGFCQPKMEPSFLGLDWSSFTTREFPEYPGDTSYLDPPEFISYGFSVLDAYATAVLAAHFSFSSHGDLTFTCELKQADPEGKLQLEFATAPERGRIDPQGIMLDLLRSIPVLLRAKSIEAGAVLFLEGEGCPVHFDYTGKMTAKASPFLRNRPVSLWPQARLTLTPTVELRLRAQEIVAFLFSSTSTGENPN